MLTDQMGHLDRLLFQDLFYKLKKISSDMTSEILIFFSPLSFAI